VRLLYFTAETCPTYRADVAVLFGKYLPRNGIHSDIVTGRAQEHQGPVMWGGGETFLCDVSGGQAKKHIKTLLHGIRHLFSADPERYDAIQVRDMPVLAAFGLLAARLKGLPFFYWMSYPMPEGQIAYARERGLSAGLMKFFFPWVRGRVGRFLLYRMVLSGADHVFVQSERMEQDMVEHGIAPEKMTPVPMGIDLEAMRIENIQPSDDPHLTGRRVLVYLGTLDRPRRIETLFDMLALVRRQLPEAMLVLVGDTEDDLHRKWLRRRAEETGVSAHVVWTGWLPMHEGWRYVRAAEVGLSPIPRGHLLDVSSPTKVPEYLTLGVPVVCNDNPDQQRLVETSGCGHCVPYTAESFAVAVLQVLELDRMARRKMVEQGRAYVGTQRDYARIAATVASSYLERPQKNET
jgi:glycosyltransferase involved in cell wall biosynthesis